MRWLRSWPDVIPPHRAYVVDEMERLTIRDYDYTPLGEIDEDVCLLEWDVALDAVMRRRFEESIAEHPEQVHVAHHYLFHVAGHPVSAHRLVLNEDNGAERWLYDDPFADLFAFGCIYLPHELVLQFLRCPAPERGRPPWVPAGHYGDTRLTDQTFSMWHYKQGLQARVVWEAYAVHLHEKGTAGHEQF